MKIAGKQKSQLRDMWRQLRQYPQGCSFEDDYMLIRGMVEGLTA